MIENGKQKQLKQEVGFIMTHDTKPTQMGSDLVNKLTNQFSESSNIGFKTIKSQESSNHSAR